jgi:hypothetical protein
MVYGTVKEHLTIINEKDYGLWDSEGTFHG